VGRKANRGREGKRKTGEGSGGGNGETGRR
jgi:hypothetical protein